jgi:hypothetical protein
MLGHSRVCRERQYPRMRKRHPPPLPRPRLKQTLHLTTRAPSRRHLPTPWTVGRQRRLPRVHTSIRLLTIPPSLTIAPASTPPL